jgi:methyl-accepting chemotaxis protein
MLTWLQRGRQGVIATYAYPGVVGLLAVLIGAYSVFFPARLPLMLEHDAFTDAAKWINVSGGGFFLIAAPRFFVSFRKDHHTDDLLFFLICALLGGAGVLFQYSKAWDLTWWAWHFLRLTGLTVVMLFSLMTFRRFVIVIADAVDRMASTATEMSAAITQHEAIAKQQAAAAEQASVTVEELARSSRHSAAQAASAAESAKKAASSTMQGAGLTRQSVDAMEDLSAKISVMADQIMQLGDQTRDISAIAVLLRELAEQINILALNATLEAARAGEHGEGFAVVASEIRKLAGQSRKAAEQAAGLIADVRKATNASIGTTEAGLHSVEEVRGLSAKVALLFGELSAIAASVNENAQAVLLNAQQQSAAFAQIADSAGAIAAGAKETSSAISQTRVGIRALNESVDHLHGVI